MSRLAVIATLLVLVLLLIALAAQSNRSTPSAPLAAAVPTATPVSPTVALPVGAGAADCPTTKPPDPPFVPPKPWPAQTLGGEFWYGTANLWTSLRFNGTWAALPHNPEGYTQKIALWPSGGEKPKITVSAKRLDASAPAYSVSYGTNACHPDFGGCIMMTGVDVPSLGCWELTIEHAGDRLSFVVWVMP